jgi:O-antigen/teichoic acid export membrane protein
LNKTISMRTAIRRIFNHPSYTRIFEWGKLITITGSAQALIQAIGLLSGIFIIRFLPTKEYALYTLANTMLGTITVLADGGIATGVMAQGGKVWQNKNGLGATIATGLDLRKRFAAFVLVFAVPALLFMLHQHSQNWLLSSLIVVSLIPTFFTSLSGTILEIAPRLHQDISSLQRIEVGASIGRLAVMIPALFTLPWACVAILCSGLPQLWANRKLKSITYAYADWKQKPDPIVRKEILPIVKRVLPGSIYYCISGQITIWLISFYGSTESVAQVGALGRLTTVLNFVNIMFLTLVVPRFARLPADRKVLFTRFWMLQFMLILISAFIVGVIVLFPNQILAILGKSYSGLTNEIVLMTISSCLGMVGGITYSVSVSRGWILPPVLNIGGNIVAQAVLLYFLDLSNTKGVLMFAIINAVIIYVMLLVYYLFKTFSFKPVQNNEALLSSTL